MDKIIDSIKKRPLNIVLMIVVSVLYILNNKMIKPLTTGSIHIFFVSYFNDLLCPLWFLGYVNLLMITVNKEVTRPKALFLICMSGGLVWEFFAPLIKKGSVTDPMDLLCYVFGTIAYWIILRGVIKRDYDKDDSN